MGSVYLITDGTLNYYGSTKVGLKERLSVHAAKTDATTRLLNKDIWSIEEVEWVEDVEELRKREQWWIDNNECVNIMRAHRTEEQRRAQNVKTSQTYQLKNAVKYKAYQKELKARRVDCECGSNVRRGDIAIHRKTNKHINFMTPK